jgi:HK97 gp10 family phage protein
MTVNFDPSELQKRIRANVMRAVIRGTESVRNEAIDLILSTAKTGRVYTRRGVDHHASAPGEPPASDTGRLIGSLVTEYDEANLTGRVRAAAEHAMPLELGTEKMEPRPFLRPAAANKQAEIEADIAAEVSKALKG